MASLILGGVGSLIFGPIGGIIGSFAGSIVDKMIIGALTPPTYGPRLTDRTVQAATFGQPKPRVYGAMRLAGNVIWSTDLKEHQNKTSVGGKGIGGGGGGTQITYTYSVSCAVGLCEGPINAVWRIWADSKVIWDSRGGTVTSKYAKNILVYLGTEDQMPDPTIEAVKHAGNVPAYRGTAYVVFKNLPLAAFGNRIPLFTFEVYGISNIPASFDVQTDFKGKNSFLRGDTFAVEMLPNSPNADAYGNFYLNAYNDGPVRVVGFKPDLTVLMDWTGPDIVRFIQSRTAPGVSDFEFAFTAATSLICGGQYLVLVSPWSLRTWVLIFKCNPDTAPTFMGFCWTTNGMNAPGFGKPSSMAANAQTLDDPIIVHGPSHAGYIGIALFPSVNDIIALDAAGGRFESAPYWIGPPPPGPLPTFLPYEVPFVHHDPMVSSDFAFSMQLGTEPPYAAPFALPYLISPASAGPPPAPPLYGTALYYYLNSAWMDANATGGNPETHLVLHAGHPLGVLLRVDLGNLDWAAALTGTQWTKDVPLTVPGTYTIDDAAWGGAFPFHEEKHYVSMGLPTLSTAGGTDAFAMMPALCQAMANGTYAVAFMMSAMSDSHVKQHDKLMWLAAKIFVYDPVARTATLVDSRAGPVYTKADVGAVTGTLFQDWNHVVWLQNDTSYLVWGFLDSGSGVLAPNTAYLAAFGQFNGAGGGSLDFIVHDICQKSGIDDSEMDTSPLGSVTVQGFMIGSEMNGRQAIDPLQRAYFFDGYESDWMLKFKLWTGIPIDSIDEDDLGARSDNIETDVDKMVEMRTQEQDLPNKITVRYMAQPQDYQTATQYMKRILPLKSTQQSLSYELPINLSDTQAKNSAEKALYIAWISRTQATFTIPRTGLKYDPSDVVTLTWKDGAMSAPVHIDQIEQGADLTFKFQGTLTDAIAFIPTAPSTAVEFPGQSSSAPEPMKPYMLDLPPLLDADDSLGYYFAATGLTPLWRGGALFRSNDAGATYAIRDAVILPALHGVVLASGVPDAAPIELWDTTNTIVVQIAFGALESVEPLQVYNGQNIALIGDEIIGFCTAVEIEPNIYQLSLLRRGIQGTGWAVGGHVGSERFLMLSSDGSVKSESLEMSELNVPETYKAVSVGQDINDIDAFTFACVGIRLKPFAPSHPQITRDGSNNITLGWTPARRTHNSLVDGADPGIDETIEAYTIDVIVSSVVKRTISVSSPTASYSAADQTTDGTTPGNPVTVAISMVSSRVGRGYPLNFTG